MTLDPAAAHQLAEVCGTGDRPLIVCDVDEVVLTFTAALRNFLEDRALALVAASFRLHGNVLDADGMPVRDEQVDDHLGDFFREQAKWQRLVPGALDGVADLSRRGDLVLLTSMKHKHRNARLTLLRELGVTAPLVSNEGSKGAAIASIARDRPVAFIDDLPGNHADVLRHVPHTTAVHFMHAADFRERLPPLPAGVTPAASWPEIVRAVDSGLHLAEAKRGT